MYQAVMVPSRNRTAEEILRLELRGATLSELAPFIGGHRGRNALMLGRIEDGAVTCGQGVGLVGEERTAGQIVEDMVATAKSLLASR